MEELVLSSYEIEALINWHVDQKYECANKERYGDAEHHHLRELKLKHYLELRGAIQAEQSML